MITVVSLRTQLSKKGNEGSRDGDGRWKSDRVKRLKFPAESGSRGVEELDRGTELEWQEVVDREREAWNWDYGDGALAMTRSKEWTGQQSGGAGMLRCRKTEPLQVRSWRNWKAQGLPWWSSGYDAGLPMQWAWVRSLVWELRSHMPCSAAKKKETERPRCWISCLCGYWR